MTNENIKYINSVPLPNMAWLVKNRQGGLASCMNLHPELFKDIKQDWDGGKTVKEHVKTAEELAKKNNGFIPYGGWLANNEHHGLVECIRKHPEAFKHIKQDWKGGKTIGEYIKTAEELAKKNGGILQNKTWLRDNGHRNVERCMNFYPEVFKHIKQNKKQKTIEEHVKTAEELAKKNDGVLQNSFWLQKNGYNRLDGCMRKHPEAFKHIKQNKKQKTIEEHIKTAEELAKKNDGVLKNCFWLKKKG